MTVSAPPSLSTKPVLNVVPALLDDHSSVAARSRALATMLAALWSGMETHPGSGAHHAHSCLIVAVDTGVGELGLRLALAFAESARPTTLVDAAAMQGSLRFFEATSANLTPSHERIGAESGDDPVLDEATVPTNVPLLQVALIASAPADAGLRRDDHVAALLDHLKSISGGATVVIAPPMQVSPDALPLVRHVDGVILAVQPGRTGRPEAIRARNAILAAGGRVLGVVLSNEATPGVSSGFRLGGLLR